ncbi:hypothetical protein JWJ88_03505 [Paracoccus methylovorus]|uniref:Twin-arginine translocation signal domain-containing protein n=1 Tax=Paracoccus methylovorus TaxID=2812658 RepID=A0ABX7JKB7_9RHOB|nr:hypothetical protein [Paracoccus methylovorus]QRZ13743.1 hypothetical protein JWJ88_03505 [Paracoccus methylovorus]
MNRRALLKAMPAALVAGAAPAVAVADEETPIAAMYREIIRLREVACDRSLPEAEGDAACDQMMDLANDIVDLPARDADDFLRKVLGYTVNGDHEIGDGPKAAEIWAEARALIGGAA